MEEAMKDTELIDRLNQLETPGHIETFTPDEAELLGAFEELALSEDDAIQGAIDLLNDSVKF
jgi:hypothetical protein